MATPSPEQTILGYNAAVAAVRSRVVAFARAAWRASPAYRDAEVARLVSMLVPRVQAGQVQVAQLTAAYIAALTATTAAPVNAATVTGGRGVPAAEVYRRPAIEVYTALSQGKPFSQAVAAGASRLESLVTTDLQMAKVRQSDASMRSTGFRFYRRVLTGAENCALCTIAATQRYHVGNLLPIHPGCDCGVQPIDVNYQLPQVLDKAELAATHDLVAEVARPDLSGRATDYRKLLITHEHGEYGPTIAWRGQHFDGPSVAS